MNEPNALDQAALAPYLEAHIPGFSGLAAIEKFKSGQSNPTYLLTAESGRYVLRAKPPGQLLKSAHQVDREFRVMKALSDTAVPVPEMLHLSAEDSPIGRMFYVMDFLDGRIFWDPALPEARGNDERAAIYDAMNATLAALHDVNAEAVGLGDFGRPGNYFERQLARWTSQYRASETSAIGDMDRLIEWLETHMPADDARAALVHGDYRLDNLIFAPDQPKVLAVLDWELSTSGHPFADIAYQCMQWRLPHASGFRGLGGIDRSALGLPSEKDYVAAYCRRRGLTGIGNWTFFLAFSFFRLAAICQGVYKRALDGNASNPEKARTYGEAVKLLSHLAAKLIDKQA
ncbi:MULTISPECIES: phosphotransferase [unclassified Mesorhizobium]|uniref:phosphotransferase n=1 Tax=unclassified Mesorhizobium TaxID=325217 RepID=UPI000FD23419|nr:MULTISPECIES: phosphotransferase [unclassified Mesorhizobium]RVD49303.1 phosphotransferase family protein [Mesorhizobium sp. M8A.F.Ca.ET.023.02.2.1]RWC80084.1 MAG: phosphotransferase family protein [Mesorhizobium sp.]TGR48661.1 phosphotransferase family protein [bacterium M00.F.Ca.ET.199.01.1.1]TGU37702.1 phosphotransferase family protein [bacterium M00.F.Ca.ET.156.01.1.1]TGU96911.1 phosphotransferase family protein [Mesorhizobium sp. M00.F.Ca.ET.151.01.1.1]TGV58031.1 phosphotransferase fa